MRINHPTVIPINWEPDEATDEDVEEAVESLEYQ